MLSTVIQKQESVTTSTVDNKTHFSYQNVYRSSIAHKTNALLGVVVNKFRNRKVKRCLNIKYLTTLHLSQSASVIEVSVSLIPIVFPATVNDGI
jgi:hypothetical protein